jgi:hypothetical protein
MRYIKVLLEFEAGEIVFLVTDIESLPRIVKRYILSPGSRIEYEIQTGNDAPSLHFGFELTKDPKEIEAHVKNLL